MRALEKKELLTFTLYIKIRTDELSKLSQILKKFFAEAVGEVIGMTAPVSKRTYMK